MPLQDKNVSEVMAGLGLKQVELSVLEANNENYSCFLLQPSGPIYAGADRIGPSDVALADTKITECLALAKAEGIELVVTPEYSTPWIVLKRAVQNNAFVSPGNLWVLGCESITHAALLAIKAELLALGCEVYFEHVDSQGTYYDPVAYCFQSQREGGDWIPVIIVQFKTCPSRDDLFLENEHLRRGETIYRFKNPEGLLSLATVICSDSFALSGNQQFLAKLIDRSILLHVQLNPNPRHDDYRLYRKLTFTASDSDLTNCDIVCLNWTRSIEQRDINGGTINWGNIGGSAWYLPKHRCATSDIQVLRNHSKGLYYTNILKERRHALLFHYDEAIFHLKVSKPVAQTFAVVANKEGPLMEDRLTWSTENAVWESAPGVPDGEFEGLLAEDPEVGAAMNQARAGACPLSVERALALTAGAIPEAINNWFHVDKLQSCLMDPDEVVCRITFASDPSVKARDFRHNWLQRAAGLSRILQGAPVLPPLVRDIGDAKIEWSHQYANFNLHKVGMRPALVAYLGDRPHADSIRNVRDKLSHLLQQTGGSDSHRVAVCYRVDEQVKFAESPAHTRIDMANVSMAGIDVVVGDTNE